MMTRLRSRTPRAADLRYEGELPMTMGGKIKHADAAALPVEHR